MHTGSIQPRSARGRCAGGKFARARTVLGVSIILAGVVCSAEAAAASLYFGQSVTGQYDYAHQSALPDGFGSGEFTLELWVRLDERFPVGPTNRNAQGQRNNWSDNDEAPYSTASWWWPGNFLLDGHNNSRFENGTFSLQIYGGGRVRWNFGDGETRVGGLWGIEAYPADSSPTLLDGQWHSIACVRRWSGAAAASLELWIDGALVAAEVSNRRTDMWATYWRSWVGYPDGQQGWFWGAEKQAAIGVLPQYEDYKGLIDDVRFWSRAKSADELETGWNARVDGSEAGLVGWYSFYENLGLLTCNVLDATECIALVNADTGTWSPEDVELGETLRVSVLDAPEPPSPLEAPAAEAQPGPESGPEQAAVQDIRPELLLAAATPAVAVEAADREVAEDSTRPGIAAAIPSQSTLSAPTDLSARAAGPWDLSIRLTWTDLSSNESGFMIERSGNGEVWTPLVVTGPGVSHYDDRSVWRGRTYHYRVHALNEDGRSDLSGVASARVR